MSDYSADDIQQLQQQLTQYSQSHMAEHLGQLDPEPRQQLARQLGQLDWSMLNPLIETHVKQQPQVELPEDIQPAPYYPLTPTEQLKAKYDQARKLGQQMIRDGHVAAFLVAGGQGTRLGWDGPKGTYPISPIKNKTLFQLFAEQIKKIQIKYEAVMPWYIMTSEANDQQTRDFFLDHNFFDIPAEQIMFFQQGTLPSFTSEGKLMLSAPDELARNPDGHGGSLRALHASGALQDMKNRGIKAISYFQVDNPNVHVVDPLFIGLHTLDRSQMSSKMLPKADPKEKVGNFCLVNGKMTVIEYSDLPDELAEQRDASGALRLRCGSIAIHVISVDFVAKLTEHGFALPMHRAVKKIPHYDPQTDTHVDPTEPNGVKLETFVFDALPLADHSIILETDRVEEFAPVKNAQGNDSPHTSRQLQIERAARWLNAADVDIPRDNDNNVDAVIELSPLTAESAEDLHETNLPPQIEPAAEIYL